MNSLNQNNSFKIFHRFLNQKDFFNIYSNIIACISNAIKNLTVSITCIEELTKKTGRMLPIPCYFLNPRDYVSKVYPIFVSNTYLTKLIMLFKTLQIVPLILSIIRYIKNIMQSIIGITQHFILNIPSFTKATTYILNSLRFHSTSLLQGIGLTLPVGIDEEIAQNIASWILQGCTKEEVFAAAQETFEKDLSLHDLIQVIAWSLACGLLKVFDLTEHFASVLAELPELPSSPSVVDLPQEPHANNFPNDPDKPIPSDSPRVDPVDTSPIRVVINFVSEHKVAIIVGSIVLVGTGIVIYIIWKRRGPTPPTGQELTPSSETGPNSISTSDVITKSFYICLTLSIIFFSTITELIINHD